MALLKKSEQLKHTDEDVIVNGECYRIPRTVNDNITNLTEEAQGRATLDKVGITMEGMTGLGLKMVEKVAKMEDIPVNDISKEIPHATPVKGVAHVEKKSSVLLPEVKKKIPPVKKSG